MGLRVQQAGPEPHLAPGLAWPAHPSADFAHDEPLTTQPFGLCSGQLYFHQRAAIRQPPDELGPGRLADSQEERLSVTGGRVGQEPAQERPVAIEPVAQQQALGGQAAEQLGGQGRFALGQIGGRDGGGQGRVRAQFHEHRAAELGKGRLEAPGGRPWSSCRAPAGCWRRRTACHQCPRAEAPRRTLGC